MKFILIILLLIEAYIFFILKSVYEGTPLRIALVMQFTIAAFTFVTLYYASSNLGHGLSQTNRTINLIMGLFVTFGITKLFFITFIFFEDVVRFFQYLSLLFSNSESVDYPSRRKVITQIGLGIASIPFTSFLYGMFRTRYDFTVFKEVIDFEDLPIEFNGFKIVQFSDFHAGSLDDVNAIKKGLEKLQNLNPDLILFTGDLVNNCSEEFDKFIPLLKTLKAPFGKYSIMGNHDYGLYYKWDSADQAKENEQRIRNHHKEIGFDLLENENRKIWKNDSSINLLGVENWGRPPFPPKGNIEAALKGKAKDGFNILLSHDPHHWEDKIKNHQENIQLTLSGHTHGMQMGIDLPGFKWSPVSLRYKKWAGLYQENNKYLYVNRGFGHIGFPGRVGIKPEITLIELRRK